MQLAHLASRLYGTPLLIARPKLDVILSVLGSRIGLHTHFPEIETALPVPAPNKASASPHAGIAVIPIYGTLVRRSMGLEAASGLMSYAEIDAHLTAALADPQVSGILLELDSPGGEAGGVFELAQRIRAANAIKPIWAHANDAAYSAAYAIAAAADRLTLSQTAGVGSIGVIALHVDQSVKDGVVDQVFDRLVHSVYLRCPSDAGVHQAGDVFPRDGHVAQDLQNGYRFGDVLMQLGMREADLSGFLH